MLLQMFNRLSFMALMSEDQGLFAKYSIVSLDTPTNSIVHARKMKMSGIVTLSRVSMVDDP